MAEQPAHDPMKDVYFVAAIVIILVIVWYAAGGPSRADLHGIFLNPPAPLGNGEATGPDPRPQGQQFEGGSVAQPEQVPQYQY